MTPEFATRLQGGPPAEVPGVRLVREVGRGAMGAVWLGHHAARGEPVAVKFLLDAAAASAEALARFRREARLAAELDEPALVRVYESSDRPVPHIVMEWVPGRGLDQVVAAAGPLTEAEVLSVLRDVGQALLALHRRGVVHRDIKPSNLLLRAADGRIQMADLGVAKDGSAADGLHTQSVVGTPSFISPEQVQDPASVGPHSDLFSLGSTAYALLTGRPPFCADSVWSTLQHVCTRPMPDPREAGADVSPATCDLIARLTEKDPARRLGTAAQLLERLPAASAVFRPAVLAAAAPPDVSAPAGPVTPLTAATVDDPRPGPAALLFCQCLQNDFLAPLRPGEPVPNKLHVGREEALRVVGADPARGPLVRAVGACAAADHVRLVHIRDWHDPDDPRQRPELDFFGDHCLMGTWGARFIDAVEAFSRDRRRAAVIDATGINDFHDTPLPQALDGLLAGADRRAVPVGVVGVWTDVKVHYLLYDLKTRAGLHNLAVCSGLVASPDADGHAAALRHLANVLNVRVFAGVDEFLEFLGVGVAAARV